jgi:hypothetical protein
MPRVCGPVLGFRGRVGEEWQVAIMVAHDSGTEPGTLTWAERGQATTSGVPAARLGEVGGTTFFGYAFAIVMQAGERSIEYGFAGEDRRWSFSVPGSGQPLRIGYASCNGFSVPGDMKRIADKNAVWRDLWATHARQPLHMLLMGGDQIYADQLWDAVPELRGFNELPREQRVAMSAGPSLLGNIEQFYAGVYRDRFSQTPVADALASIPTLMMWDDHDIFDGWGSYSDEEQASPVFRTIFAAARTCFVLFQLQSDANALSWPALPGQPSFNALLRIGSFGLLVLDLRSERSQRQVLALETWNVVLDALDRTEGLRHLFVMSSIPVVHPDMSFLERGLGFVPGMQGIEDDLHDQWVSYNHRTERLRFIHRLLDFADAKGTRVSILSGDVHVAALGVIESVRRPVRWLYANVINQLTSSPIVHPPPQRIVRYFLEQLGREVNELDQGISAQMLQFPGTNYRIIDARNWLSLEFDERERVWANWHVEGEQQVVTKVVHPCERADLITS